MQEQIAKLLCLQADKKIQNYAFSMHAVIGRGSYGIVYVGRQIDTGLPVALKVVPTQQVQSETLALIQKEIDIMKDLDSQNVVKLIDVLRTGNNYYIVSELCTSGDLKEYMKRSGAIEESVALQILVQILKGILQSFKRGIIHRDLKPANILLTHNAQNQLLFKIADFGFAKRFEHLEDDLMTSLVGTPLYMSPQVLLRRQYTAKCDIWSIGLIYYELLEGHTPWNVRDILDLVSKQRQSKIQFSKKTSKKSQQFIQGCLQYEESQRFSWEQIFTHPIFQGVFEKQPSPCRQTPQEPERPTHTTKQMSAQAMASPKTQYGMGPDTTRKTQASQNTQKRSISPSNQIMAPIKIKAPSNCKNFVRSPTQTVIKAAAQQSPLSNELTQEKQTLKMFTVPSGKNDEDQKRTVTPQDETNGKYFRAGCVSTMQSAYKKDRQISLLTQNKSQDQAASMFNLQSLETVQSDVKCFRQPTQNVSLVNYDKMINQKKCSQPQPLPQDDQKPTKDYHFYSSKTLEGVQIPKIELEGGNKKQQINYQHNLILNYLSEEFGANRVTKTLFIIFQTAILCHLDYLKYLKSLKNAVIDIFAQPKCQPNVVKLCFLLSKHAMIRSNEIKTTLIDKQSLTKISLRNQNVFDLKEFKKFQTSDLYQQLEKQIVEQHFEIFNSFQDNFIMINEHLSLVMSDSDFLEIFNNNFEPSLHFSRYAYQITYAFIKGILIIYMAKENLSDLVYGSNDPLLLKFAHALLLYAEHMKTFQFTVNELTSLLTTLQAHNPGFLNNQDQTSIPGLRYEIIGLLNKLSYYYERNH